MLNKNRASIFIPQLTDLRIVVSALGETQHFGWWKSQFLSQTGVRFLERVFPRSKFSAALESSAQVARLAHDTSIGIGDAVHLFRLPPLEESLHTYLFENAEKITDYFVPKLNNREELLLVLSEMAAGSSITKQTGPVRLKKFEWEDIRLLASIYFQGFNNKTPVFPYIGE